MVCRACLENKSVVKDGRSSILLLSVRRMNMKLLIMALGIMLLIFGTSCTEEELQQQRMDLQSRWVGALQEDMFFFQEKESQLCFAVVVKGEFNIAHIPCEPVKHLLVSAK